ncbi:MAG: polysaccharide pyruvyl transferase family protein, partial [Cyanobacteria bacterium J06555_13]
FSQSFGFHKLNRLDNALVRSTLSHAVSTWAREKISYQELLDLGVDANRIALVPDAAFVLSKQKSDRVSKLLEKYSLSPQSFWVITVRQWSTYTSSFLDEVEVFINRALSAGLTQKIVLMAHTHGPSTGGDDRIPTQQLAQRFSTQSNVVMLDDDLIPSELVAFYGEAELMIGTRFHSVIFSLVGGTPAYAVSYAGPKTWGIMKMLEMENLCSDMKDFSSGKAIASIQAENLLQVRAELPAKIKPLHQSLDDQFEQLQALV